MLIAVESTLDSILPGGWIPFRPVTAREVRIFDELIGEANSLGNVHYTRKKCPLSLLPEQIIVLNVWLALMVFLTPLNGRQY